MYRFYCLQDRLEGQWIFRLCQQIEKKVEGMNLLRVDIQFFYPFVIYQFIQINSINMNQSKSISDIHFDYNYKLQTQQDKIHMKGQQAYISTIRSALQASLCLRDFPSVLFEKDNKPYVELSGYSPAIQPFILKPIYLARNKKQQFLVEPSINSCRISFTLKKSDQVDKLIAGKFSSMVAARAELFEIIRRKPIQGYDVTLLITNESLQKYHKDFIIELIVGLVSNLEKDLVEVKLNINTQCRIAATYFMEQISNPKDEPFF